MIICWNTKLEIGKIYDENILGTSFQFCKEFHSSYKFKVMREANLEEYRLELNSTCAHENPDEVLEPNFYYYQISID